MDVVAVVEMLLGCDVVGGLSMLLGLDVVAVVGVLLGWDVAGLPMLLAWEGARVGAGDVELLLDVSSPIILPPSKQLSGKPPKAEFISSRLHWESSRTTCPVETAPAHMR